MNSKRLSRTRQVAIVGLERRHDVLLLELAARLVQSNSAPHQLIDDLSQAPVEILLCHRTALCTACVSRRSMTLPQLPDGIKTRLGPFLARRRRNPERAPARSGFPNSSFTLGYWCFGSSRSPTCTV